MHCEAHTRCRLWGELIAPMTDTTCRDNAVTIFVEPTPVALGMVRHIHSTRRFT